MAGDTVPLQPGHHRCQNVGDREADRERQQDALHQAKRDYSEQQLRLLRELYVLYQASGGRGGYYGYAYGDDRSIELSSVGSRQLWPLLDEAEADLRAGRVKPMDEFLTDAKARRDALKPRS